MIDAPDREVQRMDDENQMPYVLVKRSIGS